MNPAAQSRDEEQRLAALMAYAVLDTAPEAVFDDLAGLAAQACGSPIALISLTDGRRQWFKSRVGLSVTEIARDASFCGHAILQPGVLVVHDAARDPRFAASPLVTDHPGVRFYAGAPLVAPTGVVLGTLCVMDLQPRALSAPQQHALVVLGRQVVAQLELRRQTFDLAERERFLETIVESEPECVKVLGRDGSLRMMNRAGLRMIEADSFEQVAGHCIYPLVAEEDRADFLALTERVFRGETDSLEFWVRGLKGGTRLLETHAVPLLDKSGEVAALLGITRDVTERQQAYAALGESERNFRLLFEQATDGIFVADAHGRLLDVNPAGCDMTGYSREELRARTIADLVPPAEIPAVARQIARLTQGLTITREWRVLRKDGTSIVSEVKAKRLPDGRLQAFTRDITDRRRAEAALRENEDRLRRAVRAGRVGLWDWDLANNAVYFSAEWKRQIGYEDDEIADDFEQWRCRVHADDLGPVLERIDAFLASELAECETEFRFRHKDGSYRRILAHMSKVAGEDGRAVRLLGSHVDITERAALQVQFLQAQKIESVGRLAGGIAHDFNNLLTVINGMTDLAIGTLRDADPLHSDLEQIRLAGDRAAALTRQLLALSRQQILKPEVINLSTIVNDMQSMLRRLIGEDVELVCALSGSLGSVKADPGQIEQVILNLAINARDAMPDGGTLTIATRDGDIRDAAAAGLPTLLPGPCVVLTVADTGLGMDEATQKRIFEPFFTTKAVGKGTGLGLSTVYGIVKQSGGSVVVSSEPGAGATFEICLPRVAHVAHPPQAEPAALPRGGTETILLVEDERALRNLASRILRAEGYAVLEAGNGGEALILLDRYEGPVHLMLTDVVMPGMNGRELAGRLAEVRPAMKVLYTSGYTDDAILRHGVLDDTTRFVTKPYTPAELKRRVRSLLDS